jgi:hypothetical protein
MEKKHWVVRAGLKPQLGVKSCGGRVLRSDHYCRDADDIGSFQNSLESILDEKAAQPGTLKPIIGRQTANENHGDRVVRQPPRNAIRCTLMVYLCGGKAVIAPDQTEILVYCEVKPGTAAPVVLPGIVLQPFGSGPERRSRKRG